MTPSSFPSAVGLEGGTISEAIRRAGEIWATAPSRPRVEKSVAVHWDGLLEDWARDATLPLLIRKASLQRGQPVEHASGRLMVPVDNSPAHWAFALAIAGVKPALPDVRDALGADRVPVAMILKASERASAYRCTLGSIASPQSAGWKLAHIRAVGLGGRTPLHQLPTTSLVTHFQALMAPSNMFVIPQRWAGLAEVEEFVQAINGA